MSYTIPSLKNACKVVNLLAKSTTPLSCLEVARFLNLPRTTILRILDTLADEGYLFKQDRRYNLGEKLAEIAETSLTRLKLFDVVEPALARLTNITGETSHFGLQNGNKIWIARVCESPLPLHAASHSGTLVDAHCSGTGKAILAQLLKTSPEQLKKFKLEKRTKNTLTTFTALQKDLKKILKQGYAIDNEEYHENVRCLGVPVFDKFGVVLGAIGITAPAIRFTKNNELEMFKIVNDIAIDISQKLGVSC